MSNTRDQHQPIRIPDKWDGQERMVIVQLEQLLDTIFRRLGDLDRRLKELESQE